MYISEYQDLKAFCERAASSKILAVDTEFLREKTYYPKLCLIQIATYEESACVDPLAIDDLSPLRDLLVDKRRIELFDAIEDIYRSLSNEARGIVVADVTSAQELTSAQQEKIQKKLATVTGKEVTLRTHRDESLIGGVVVRIGDKRIDGSVKGRLEEMTAQLLAN